MEIIRDTYIYQHNHEYYYHTMPEYNSAMFNFLLLVATTILLTVVNSAPLPRVDKENTIDPTAASAARDDNEAFYEHVKESYILQGCLSTWGDFPSLAEDSTTLSRLRTPSDQRSATTDMTMTMTMTTTTILLQPPCLIRS